jgi:hypothetical protein
MPNKTQARTHARTLASPQLPHPFNSRSCGTLGLLIALSCSAAHRLPKAETNRMLDRQPTHRDVHKHIQSRSIEQWMR